MALSQLDALEWLMTFVFWICTALLFYVYQGYLWLLRLWPSRSGGPTPAADLPSLTVLLTVHNEIDEIAARLENLLDQDYPAERLRILVASDGSDDGTDAAVAAFRDPRIALVPVPGQRGKTAAQNLALAGVDTELVVFTDAGTRFERSCLRELAQAFADARTGGATGMLRFAQADGSGVSRDQGRYWAYETRLRQRESELGLLAVATGACLVARRRLIRPMPESLAEDCIVPLETVSQGFRFVFVAGAQAWDHMPHGAGSELRTRIRMTLRDWQGTWSYPRLLSPVHHPGYALSLWSHKLLRWCSPLLLLGATVSVAVLAQTSPLYLVLALLFAAFYLGALLGFWAERRGRTLPLIHSAYSFLLAMVGFAVGVVQAILGVRVRRYGSETLKGRV